MTNEETLQKIIDDTDKAKYTAIRSAKVIQKFRDFISLKDNEYAVVPIEMVARMIWELECIQYGKREFDERMYHYGAKWKIREAMRDAARLEDGS